MAWELRSRYLAIGDHVGIGSGLIPHYLAFENVMSLSAESSTWQSYGAANGVKQVCNNGKQGDIRG